MVTRAHHLTRRYKKGAFEKIENSVGRVHDSLAKSSQVLFPESPGDNSLPETLETVSVGNTEF